MKKRYNFFLKNLEQSQIFGSTFSIQTIMLSTNPNFEKFGGAVSQNDKLANSNVAKKRIKGRRMPRAT